MTPLTPPTPDLGREVWEVTAIFLFAIYTRAHIYIIRDSGNDVSYVFWRLGHIGHVGHMFSQYDNYIEKPLTTLGRLPMMTRRLPMKRRRQHTEKALSPLLMKGLSSHKSGGLLLSRIALQYHRRRRA